MLKHENLVVTYLRNTSTTNCINMFTNLLIEAFKLLTGTFGPGEVCYNISGTMIIGSNLELEIYTVYQVQWDKGSNKLCIIQS